jgi:hypothetical protein
LRDEVHLVTVFVNRFDLAELDQAGSEALGDLAVGVGFGLGTDLSCVSRTLSFNALLLRVLLGNEASGFGFSFLLLPLNRRLLRGSFGANGFVYL